MNDQEIEIITEKAKDTQKVGQILAQEIIKSKFKSEKALVIGLGGDLGSGKTTFIQGLARGFKIKERITSPTFVILKKFDFFYHIDCYRINHPRELLEIDFKEILNQSGNIIVIEWAERVKKILPLDTLWIKFKYLTQNKRRIVI